MENTTAGWAEHVPRQLEETKSRRMQESGDRLLFVEAAVLCECQRVQPVQCPIGSVSHEVLYRGDHPGIG
jgi:hypothetical protein